MTAVRFPVTDAQGNTTWAECDVTVSASNWTEGSTVLPGTVGSSGASGEPMPTADVGDFTYLFGEDFNTDCDEGDFLHTWSGGQHQGGVYRDTMDAYPYPWDDTGNNGFYDPSIISVSNSLMRIRIHTDSATGEPRVAAPQPRLFGPTASAAQGQLYGRYAVRIKADPLLVYKTAYLLWPSEGGTWDQNGEVDYPEGGLSGDIGGFVHELGSEGGQANQNAASAHSDEPYTQWNTCIIEWIPGNIKFILNGVTILDYSGTHVPNTNMRWVLQNETNSWEGGTPDPATEGYVDIDWVAAWSYSG